MLKRVSIFFFILSFLWPLPWLSAQTLSLDEVVEKVQNNYDKMENFSAKFIQISTNRSLNQTQETLGQVYLKKPGFMHWEYGAPDNQLIIGDGVNVWMYLPKLKQVYKEDANQVFEAKTPLAFLSGKGKISENFKVSLERDSKNGENYVLKLIPKELHPALNQMILEIDPETFWIKSTKVNDIYENTIELKFTGIKTNQNLPANLFQFTIPQGSELITPSKGK